LAERYGERFSLDVASPAEAFRALCSQLPGFRQHIERHSEPGYHVFADGNDRGSEKELRMSTSAIEIHFVPVIAGAGAAGRIVGGIFLIVASFFGAPTLNLGMALVLGGVSELLAPKPKAYGTNDRPDNKPSFLFQTQVNTSMSGGCMPVVIGRFEVGSVVGSASIRSYDYSSQTTAGAPDADVIVDVLLGGA